MEPSGWFVKVSKHCKFEFVTIDEMLSNKKSNIYGSHIGFYIERLFFIDNNCKQMITPEKNDVLISLLDEQAPCSSLFNNK